MVKSMEITKSSIRERLIIDSEVWMHHPDDHDFQPRASIEGRILSIQNAGKSIEPANIELSDEEYSMHLNDDSDEDFGFGGGDSDREPTY